MTQIPAYHLKVQAQGRVVLPVALRTELYLEESAPFIRRAFSLLSGSLGLGQAHRQESLALGRCKYCTCARLPHHLVGSHRRIALADLLAYQQEQARRRALADELSVRRWGCIDGPEGQR